MASSQPNKKSECTWKANEGNSPHINRTEFPNRQKILPDILNTIGQTPLVKLNRIPKDYGIKCEMYVKCEFFNPGGSIKDRIAHRMIEDAEEKGLIKPGYTIIEPTSGNTGIGLAMAAAVKGYNCIIVMPEKMSNEKVCVLQAFGAKIVKTPTEASWKSFDSHISVARQLQKKTPHSIILDQYTNASNPLAHYDGTAMEIWEQCEKKVDYVVIGAGTGGTITGIGRKFKELSPSTKIIGVDPKGSILAEPATLNEDGVGFYEVEGIGYDFIPTVLSHDVVDTWIKSEDCESLKAARELIRKEGLLCGGSSGSALSAALKIAKDLPEDKRVVVLLPDGVRNYMTKFMADEWMEERNFLPTEWMEERNCLPTEASKNDSWWWDLPVSKLTLNKTTLPKGISCRKAAEIFGTYNIQQMLVMTESLDRRVKEKHVQGIITSDVLFSKLITGELSQSDSAEAAQNKKYPKVKTSTTISKLLRFLEKNSYAVVLNDDNEIIGVATLPHIYEFISKTR